MDALLGIYVSPAAEQPLWYRLGKQSAVESNERAEGWETCCGKTSLKLRHSHRSATVESLFSSHLGQFERN